MKIYYNDSLTKITINLTDAKILETQAVLFSSKAIIGNIMKGVKE
jgi:hypothetical protein